MVVIVRNIEIKSGKRVGIYACIPRRDRANIKIASQSWRPVSYTENKDFYRENKFTKSWMILKHPSARSPKQRKDNYQRLLKSISQKLDRDNLI